MKPPPFAYHVPETLEEAYALKAEHGADARALAGGQSLIPLMTSRRLSPSVVIDIKRIPELQAIRRENGTLVLGAVVRQCQVTDDETIATALPLLADGASYIGHPETRHRGTVGGSVAHADPVAELPNLAVALGAQVVVANAGGSRSIAADDFFTGARETVLAADELVTEVHFPTLGAATGWGFAEIARRHGDPAIATATALIEIDGSGAASRVEITMSALSTRPRRATAVEDALQGGPITAERIAEASRAAGELAEDQPRPIDAGPTPTPPNLPAGYRRRIAAAACEQALTRAFHRVTGGSA
jgi:carbon-monoxide dehydrogenase medium subunit